MIREWKIKLRQEGMQDRTQEVKPEIELSRLRRLFKGPFREYKHRNGMHQHFERECSKDGTKSIFL